MHQLRRFQLQNVCVRSMPCSDVISLIKLLVRCEELPDLGVRFFSSSVLLALRYDSQVFLSLAGSVS